MGRIQSNIGLITGIPIAQTVDQLVALQARPRENLEAANKTLTDQQVALTELTAQLISLQINADRLSVASIYSERTATSSVPTALGVTSTGTPPLGSYSVTPIRQVQTHQLLSSRLSSATDPLGAGTMKIGFGGFIDPNQKLDLLNQGEGIARGKFRITDRSGGTAEIDLSLATTVGDVLTAINSADAISVTASVEGDHFRLVDTSGSTAGNLRVAEVGSGETAASLGLAGVDVAADSATGDDLLQLFDGLQLSRLNAGNGIRFDDVLADVQVDLRDGTSLEIDFQKLAVQGTRPRGTTNNVNVNANITVEAKTASSDFLGVNVLYQNDDSIIKGEETVAYDADIKTLIFKIDAGQSTASDLLKALNGDDGEAGELFSGVLPSGGSGSGVVDAADVATLAGRYATAVTPGTLGVNSSIRFTALADGGDLDDVTIQFVHGGPVGVEYDDSDPGTKTLTFTINQNSTTADDVIAMANDDPTVGALFFAERAAGGDGSGLLDVDNDTAVTDGGAFIEAVPAADETTLGHVLATINAVNPAKLQAEYTADGLGIRLIDLSADNGGTFGVSSINGSKAAEDLGLTVTADANAIDGQRLLGGLNSVLLRNLNGGAGFGELGEITLQDRSGAADTVDLSGAVTVQDILTAINAAGVGVEARINKDRDGIEIVDTTGATAANLQIANNDATNTADVLGIAVDAATTSVDSGSLNLQIVSENTLLANLNGGNGVSAGSVLLTDTNGQKGTLNINSNIKTIGEVIEEIDRLGLGIEARINDAGTGLLLVDTAAGSGPLSVEAGAGSSAADLHLLGAVQEIDVEGTPTKVIDGSTIISIDVGADDSLTDLIEKINEAGVGVSASLFNDGSGIKPYRLNLSSETPGTRGELRVSTAGLAFAMEESIAAKDALLRTDSGQLVSSSTNKFSDVINGVTLTVNAPSETPVTVTVAASQSKLRQNVIAFVETYNRIQDAISALTAFDTETNERALLQGDGAMLRVENDLANLVSGRFFGAGVIQTIAELGITTSQSGQLSFNQTIFDEKLAADPAAVEQFLSSANQGFADKAHAALERLTNVDNSVLVNRTEGLSRKIDNNAQRIDFLNARLERSRERLLLDFYNMELSIAKIQSNLSSIQSLAPLPPLTSTRS